MTTTRGAETQDNNQQPAAWTIDFEWERLLSLLAYLLHYMSIELHVSCLTLHLPHVWPSG